MGIVALPGKSVRGSVGASGPSVGAAGPKVGAAGPDAPELRNRADPADLSWHSELAHAIRDPAELIAALELPAALLPAAKRAAESFPLFAPWPYIQRMAKGDLSDPLLRQVLPLA